MAAASLFLTDLKRAFFLWRSRNPTLIAAGLAYFALFSLIPLTVLTIAVAGHMFAASDARLFVISEFERIFNAQAAQSLSIILGRVERSAGPASLVSAGILAWVGSRLFIQLQIALSAMWDIVPHPRTRLGRVKAYVLDRTRAFLATLGFGLLAFVFFMADLVFAYFRDFLGSVLSPRLLSPILPAVSLLISLLLFAMAFASIYRWLPAAHPGWRAVWSGAGVASVLFAIGRVGMTMYLHRRDFLSLFGAAGSVAVILIWVYYSMLILLFGATFAAVVGERRPSSLHKPGSPSV